MRQVPFEMARTYTLRKPVGYSKFPRILSTMHCSELLAQTKHPLLHNYVLKLNRDGGRPIVKSVMQGFESQQLQLTSCSISRNLHYLIANLVLTLPPNIVDGTVSCLDPGVVAVLNHLNHYQLPSITKASDVANTAFTVGYCGAIGCQAHPTLDDVTTSACPFTVAKLLEMSKSKFSGMMVAPAAILIALQPFQQRTLAWMIQRETGEADESGPSFSTAFSYLVRMQHQSCVVLPLSSENQYFLVLIGWYLLQVPSIRSSRVS